MMLNFEIHFRKTKHSLINICQKLNYKSICAFLIHLYEKPISVKYQYDICKG